MHALAAAKRAALLALARHLSAGLCEYDFQELFRVRLRQRIASFCEWALPPFSLYSGYPAATLRNFGRPALCSSSVS